MLNVSDFHPFRITHSKLFADRHNHRYNHRYNHINGIENFWNQAKRHVRKFKGLPTAQFGLYLKECEGRFNNSDPTAQILKLRQWGQTSSKVVIWVSPKENTDLRVAILTGTGESFCAGADLGELRRYNFDENPLEMLADMVETLPFPTICALNGGVYGGGADWPCHVILELGWPG